MADNAEYKKYGITAKKYAGDDRYSWAVMVHGKPQFTGLGQSEVGYYKALTLQNLKRRKEK